MLVLEFDQCGNSELRLSAVGLGCWELGGGAYWGECRQQDADAVVRRAVELGINYFDSAEAEPNAIENCHPPSGHDHSWSPRTMKISAPPTGYPLGTLSPRWRGEER